MTDHMFFLDILLAVFRRKLHEAGYNFDLEDENQDSVLPNLWRKRIGEIPSEMLLEVTAFENLQLSNIQAAIQTVDLNADESVTKEHFLNALDGLSHIYPDWDFIWMIICVTARLSATIVMNGNTLLASRLIEWCDEYHIRAHMPIWISASGGWESFPRVYATQ